MGGFPPVGYGSGSGSPPTDIIYRKGAASAGNVYGSDAEVAAAIAAVNGACNVWIDGSIEPCTLGTAWNLFGMATIQADPASGTTLEILDGGQIQNPGAPCVIGVTIYCDCQTIPSFSWTTWVNTTPNAIGFSFASLFLNPSCTIPPIQVPADPKGNALYFLVERITALEVFGAPAGTIVELGENALFVILGLDMQPSEVDVNLFSGDGTTAWAVFGDASMWPLPAFTSASVFAGQRMLDNAAGVEYAPTTPNFWGTSPPTTDQQALDALAGSGILGFPVSQPEAGSGSTCLGGFSMANQALCCTTTGQATVAVPGGGYDGAWVTCDGSPGDVVTGSALFGSIVGSGAPSTVFLSSILSGYEGIPFPNSGSFANPSRMMNVTATANDGNGNIAGWTFSVLAHLDPLLGVLTLDAVSTGTFLSAGADAALWTLVPTVNGTDQTLYFEFTNGLTTNTVVCKLRADWAEVPYS